MGLLASEGSKLRDPVTFEVFKNAVSGLADEMAITIVRTAHSQIIGESLDFSTALCDAEGRVVAQGNCAPVHMGAMPDAMDAVLRKYGGTMESGDIYLFNDPDEGGMHLQDIFVVKPVFAGADLCGFAICVGHHADIGGRVPGSNAVDSTEIFQEGLQLPLLKLYEAGTLNETLIAILERNVRLPELVRGDLQAQVSACFTGEEGILGLVERHGLEGFTSLVDELLEYSERLLRARLAAMRDGTYEFEDYLDDDGFGTEEIPIRVKVVIEGDAVHFDFTGSAPQVPSALNCTASFTKSSAYAALQAAVGGDIPSNSGFYRPVSFTLPSSTILNGTRPAARAARGIVGYRVVDAVWGALAPVLPEHIPAASDGGPSIIAVGTVAEDGTATIVLDVAMCAWGARAGMDGLDGVSALAGNLANTPVEELEQTRIVRVEQYAYVADSGGAGRWRGGLAVARDIRLLHPIGTLQIRTDRRHHRPYGLRGGAPGASSWNILNPGPDQVVLPTKVTTTMRQGDLHRHITAGGGGFGDPLERDLEHVHEDVLNEKVTLEAAARDYGVIITAEGVVDADSTETLRGQLRQERAQLAKE